MRRSRAASAVLIDDLIDGDNHVGLVHIDSDGFIVERSAAARELLQSGRGLRERRGRLTAERPEQAEALERLLLDTASKGFRREAVTVSAPDGRRVIVHAHPVVNGSPEVRGADGPSVAACVLLVDPWGEVSGTHETLMEALGLTTMQSQIVADLVRGMTVREIAEATQRAPGSVRWHVKCALKRTGVRRQSDLVRIALAATSIGTLDRKSDASSRSCPSG